MGMAGVRGKRFAMDDLDAVPPLEIDKDGYALPPDPISPKTRYKLTEAGRKVRFILTYNFSAGFISLSCQEAGILKAVYLDWLANDPVFKKRLREADEEITDRMIYRLSSQIGLVEMSDDQKVNNAALMAIIKARRPSIFMESGESGFSIGFGRIPRPQTGAP